MSTVQWQWDYNLYQVFVQLTKAFFQHACQQKSKIFSKEANYDGDICSLDKLSKVLTGKGNKDTQ